MRKPFVLYKKQADIGESWGRTYKELEDIHRGQPTPTLKRDFAVVVIFVQTNTAEREKKSFANMSSLSGRTSQTRSQESYRASSQEGMGAALEDTASSTLIQFRAKGSSTAISLSVAPNSAYTRRRALTHACSALPVPH